MDCPVGECFRRRRARYELVKEGGMEPVALELVTRPLISQEELWQRITRALE